jgi:hypothetical protein
LLCSFAALPATAAVPFLLTDLTVQPIAHGGGCRKSSAPGQCCHMQKSTGQVHCH